MRLADALDRFVLGRRVRVTTTFRVSGCVRAAIVLPSALICALGVAGCAPEYAKSAYAPSGAARPTAAAAKAPRARVPLPAQALLEPVPGPKCESRPASVDEEPHPTHRPASASARIASLDAKQSPDGPVLADVPLGQVGASSDSEPQLAEIGSDANLILLAKLSRELQCYQQAESAVRKRLRELQASVAETIKAVNGAPAKAP